MLLFASDSVDAVLAVRVLVVLIKLILFHRRVSDELGSNLLELCTALLVDSSGVSTSVMIKPVTCTLKVIFAFSSFSMVFSTIWIKTQMMIVTETFLVSVGAGICMDLETCIYTFVQLAVKRTLANSPRVSCGRCRAHSFVCNVSLYCNVSKPSTKSMCLAVKRKPANSCVHLSNRGDVVRCCHN